MSLLDAALSARVPVSGRVRSDDASSGTQNGVKLTLRPSGESTVVHTARGACISTVCRWRCDEARSIPSVELDSYQRAARLVLTHHLVTATFPDRSALATVRRWATELREDLLATFGYRLEVTETTARLFTVADRLDAGAGTSTHTGRPFDRRRYAYLALAIAALGRAPGRSRCPNSPSTSRPRRAGWTASSSIPNVPPIAMPSSMP